MFDSKIKIYVNFWTIFIDFAPNYPRERALILVSRTSFSESLTYSPLSAGALEVLTDREGLLAPSWHWYRAWILIHFAEQSISIYKVSTRSVNFTGACSYLCNIYLLTVTAPFFFALESGRPDFWKIRSTLFWALVLRIRA